MTLTEIFKWIVTGFAFGIGFCLAQWLLGKVLK
jgi:hypothetical protein